MCGSRCCTPRSRSAGDRRGSEMSGSAAKRRKKSRAGAGETKRGAVSSAGAVETKGDKTLSPLMNYAEKLLVKIAKGPPSQSEVAELTQLLRSDSAKLSFDQTDPSTATAIALVALIELRVHQSSLILIALVSALANHPLRPHVAAALEQEAHKLCTLCRCIPS